MPVSLLLPFINEPFREKLGGSFTPSLEKGIHSHGAETNKNLFGVRVVTFKDKQNFSPVFCLGAPSIIFPNLYLGYIFIGEKFSKSFTESELGWILLHEIGHIVHGHNVTKAILNAPEILKIINPNWGLSKDIKDAVKGFQLVVEGSSSEDDVFKQQELEADIYASNVLGKKTGLSVLNKLNKICGGVSHSNTVFGVEYPYLFINERINNLNNQNLLLIK
jgi:hypothetical protein